MIPYRTRYSNLSVVTRVCPTSSKDPDGSGVVREVWSTGSSLTENDSRVGGPQFHNRKGQVSIRARLYSDQVRLRHHHGPPGRFGPAPHSRFQNGAGGLTLINKHNGTFRQRCNPYGRPSRRREGWIHRRGGGGAPRLGGGAGRRGEGNEGKKWFKIIIPYGNKYNKKWLLTALQNLCPVPFIPQFYSTEGHKVHFYLEDAVAASALCSLTRRITDNEGYKVVVFMNQCSTPPFVQNELKPQDLEHLKQCMSKRFDTSQKSLDLSSIRTDPDLVSQNIDMILSRKYYIEAVIKIIEENIPELQCLNLSNNWLFKLDDVAELVTKAPGLTRLNLSHNGLKSERELDKVKGFRLAELWLDRNPLCNHFKDQTTYISAVRERFPRLLKLDGHDLSPPIGFDVETHSAIPQCKGSYFVSEDIRSLIHRFLQHYYSVYDSGDRQPLLDAYHDGSCFSLSVSFTNNPSRCSLGEYHKDSRNVKKLKDPSTRFRLLKHTRVTVVAFLNELPKTQHDITSFIVDVNTYTSTLLAFTVSGVFKETDGKSRDSVRAFSRVFVAVPAGNSGLCIVNDELFVRNATTEEIRRAFVAPAPTPSSSPVPTLSASQQEMLYAFSQKSEMNLEWSQKCLQDNEWNFNRAAQIFTELKAQGKIPQAAFIK